FLPRRDCDWQALLAAFRQAFATQGGKDARIEVLENHAVLTCSVPPGRVRAWLSECDPAPAVLSVGRCMDVYKDEGRPERIAQRYHFAELAGTHWVGHTRMATEPAVTPAQAHPYTAGADT